MRLSKEAKSLLLYLETRCLDYSAKIDSRHLNNDYRDLLKHWNSTGFVKSGEICCDHIKNPYESTWCKLSDEAFIEAHKERKKRVKRTWENKPYMTTEEFKKGNKICVN